jgi:hypothetical protein
MSPRALLFLALASSGCGQALQLEAEAPRVCITLPGQPVVGAPLPPGAPSTPQTVATRLDFPLDKVASSVPKGASVALLSVELVAQSGRDFGFVESADVRALDASTGQPGAVIARYQSSGGAPGSLLLQPSPPWDATPSLSAKRLSVELGVTAPPPKQVFAADAVACFSATVSASVKVP